MSKPLTLWMKIKIFRLWLKQQEEGVLVNCSYCDSTNVKFEDQFENNFSDVKIYNSLYTCVDCGAICRNRQEWQKN
ncbi:hypothetical protein GCM10008931_44010 [Oceanobacillus oncorhynchi subsp. oncorhynchi]